MSLQNNRFVYVTQNIFVVFSNLTGRIYIQGDSLTQLDSKKNCVLEEIQRGKCFKNQFLF